MAENNAIYKITIQNSSGTTDREIGAKAENILVKEGTGSISLTEKLSAMTTLINNNKVPGVATATTDGLMSRTDFSKLSGIAENANNYSLPVASSSTLGGVKIGNGITISSGVINADIRDVKASSSAGCITVNLKGTDTNIKVAGWDSVQTAANLVNNGGAFTKTMKAVASDDSTAAIRNITYTNTDPGVDNGDYGTANNGLLICVYE